MQDVAWRTVLALSGVALVACEAIPDVDYVDATAPIGVPDAAGTVDQASPDAARTPDASTTSDASDAAAPDSPSSEWCPSSPPTGFKCCESVVCKGECDTDECNECRQLNCGVNEICCEKSGPGGGGGAMKCANASLGGCK